MRSEKRNVAEIIYNRVQKSGRVSTADIQEETGLSRSRASNHLRALVDLKILKSQGKGGATVYLWDSPEFARWTLKQFHAEIQRRMAADMERLSSREEEALKEDEPGGKRDRSFQPVVRYDTKTDRLEIALGASGKALSVDAQVGVIVSKGGPGKVATLGVERYSRRFPVLRTGGTLFERESVGLEALLAAIRHMMEGEVWADERSDDPAKVLRQIEKLNACFARLRAQVGEANVRIQDRELLLRASMGRV